MDLSQILNQSPHFKSWVENKKLNPKELSILTEFSKMDSIQPILKWIGKNQPSHSQGSQILELSGELLLMGKSLKTLFEQESNSKFLLKKLKDLRQPLSAKQDKMRSQIVKNLPWSSFIKGKWVRKNDRGFLEVSFQSSSLKDLEQKIKNLEQIRNTIKMEKKLWDK